MPARPPHSPPGHRKARIKQLSQLLGTLPDGAVGATTDPHRSADPHSVYILHNIWHISDQTIDTMRNLSICAGAIVTICVGWALFGEFSDSREKLRVQDEMLQRQGEDLGAAREMLQRQGEELASTRRELMDRLANVETAANNAQLSGNQHILASRQEYNDLHKNMNDMHRRLAMVEVADKMKDMRANMPGSPSDTSAAGEAQQRRALQDDPGDHQGICLDPAHVAVAATDSAYAVSRAFERFMVERLPLLARITCAQAPPCVVLRAKVWLTFLRALMSGTSWRGCRLRPTTRR